MNLAERLRTALANGHAQAMDLLTIDPRITTDIELRPAAVLVAITDRTEPGLILTERSARLRTHAGQTAFPGGRVDDSDKDEVAAALREAQEEINLPPHVAQIIGITDRFHTFTGFDIVPVLAVIPPDLPLRPCADEVADWFEMPFSFALDPANRSRHLFTKDGRSHHYYEIMWEGRRIWGITAAILVNLSRRLGYER